MEISYPYHVEVNPSIRGRVHDGANPPPLLTPYPRAAALSLQPCLTLQRGWRSALEDRGWIHSPLALSLGPYGCKKLTVAIDEGLERSKHEGEQKLKFGVESILSSEFGNQKRKFLSGKFELIHINSLPAWTTQCTVTW